MTIVNDDLWYGTSDGSGTLELNSIFAKKDLETQNWSFETKEKRFTMTTSLANDYMSISNIGDTILVKANSEASISALK